MFKRLDPENYGNHRLTAEEAGIVIDTIKTKEGFILNRHKSLAVKVYDQEGYEVEAKSAIRIISDLYGFEPDGENENTRNFGKRIIESLKA